MSALVIRRARTRNLAVVGAEDSGSSGLVTAMLATMSIILILGLFSASEAASGRGSTLHT